MSSRAPRGGGSTLPGRHQNETALTAPIADIQPPEWRPVTSAVEPARPWSLQRPKVTGSNMACVSGSLVEAQPCNPPHRPQQRSSFTSITDIGGGYLTRLPLDTHSSGMTQRKRGVEEAPTRQVRQACLPGFSAFLHSQLLEHVYMLVAPDGPRRQPRGLQIQPQGQHPLTYTRWFKRTQVWGARLALLQEHATLNHRIVSLSPMPGAEITKK